MKIVDLLKVESIDLKAKPQNKAAALEHLITLMERGGNIADKEEYKACVLRREEEGSTGIGEGIAIPHAKTSAVKAPGLAAMLVQDGVDFDSLDGEPAKLFFLIAAPDTEDNVHLDVLSHLSMLLMNDDFRSELLKAGSAKEFLSVIDKYENEKFEDEDEAAAPQAQRKVLAVTACPTGIAHTYMAAEALQEMAGKLGVAMKVETNGSGGVKNKLTAKEIEEAEGIIVAADKNVPVERFAGKPVIFVKVADGINKPKELIEEILSGKVPAYAGKGGSEAEGEAAEAKESLGRQIYKHLMNGVSHMLPFVIGGGILIALAFMFDMEFAGTAKFGSGTPLAAFFKNIGGLAFSMMMPILAGYIAMSIGERPALMLGIVGGFLAASGGSGFFGALFAGFLGGYLIIALRKALSVLPDSLEGLKPILLYPVLGLLIMGVLMTYVINPPTAAFNQWLAGALAGMSTTSKVLMGFVLGGMMSIDFGGPLNKAAYVFGTASLAAADGSAVSSEIMAAVMIGGMVPPIAIALSTLLFSDKFTAKERQSGLTNFIMGLSFITEGAIPFAASDPLRVIPTCALGSAMAGALSMAFGCSVPAPHGGVFVFGVVQNWPMYFVALAAGSVVAAVLMGFVKKSVKE
ncbi:fructose-specific PTS transporter subunit EIIC [uncultured Phascolarctobacterium sp.]|jgi:PTS system fructose-specific IIC component|uniref:PTS fructose transporter subunit IIABC n=1 Tax=uncultured Phascolarctobacterium sp. TaxID=512296 RepID=UPI0025EBBA65|nr:fructose-specific PTS transporter subunit EIIC [uncultured Phascolarctobacterium sp.]